MLVLSRKEGEQVVIDENIVITINRIAGHRVSIGIEAPAQVHIKRSELQTHSDTECDCAIGAGV